MANLCRTCGFQTGLDAFHGHCSSRCCSLARRIPTAGENPLDEKCVLSPFNVGGSLLDLSLDNATAYLEWARDASVATCGVCNWFLGPKDEVAGIVEIFSNAELAAGLELSVSRLLEHLAPLLPYFVRRGVLQPLQWLDVLENENRTEDVVRCLAIMRSGLPSKSNSGKALSLPWSLCDHSCSPALMFRSDGAVVTARRVAKGERLTISRLRPIELRMSTSVRQEILAMSCGSVRCKCERCEMVVDNARGIHCGCGGTRQCRTTRSSIAEDREAWRCNRCGETWSDTDMQSVHEEQLCESVYGLWLAMRDVGSGLANLTKTTFKQFRVTATNVQDVLGDHHWCSLVVAETAVYFYKAFMRAFADDTKHEAQRQIAQWATRWLLLARQQQFVDAAPSECAAFLRTITDVVTEPSLYVPRHELLHAANGLVAQQQLQCPPISSVGGRLLLSCEIDAHLVTPSELLDQWEQFLVSKVSTAAQSNPSCSGIVSSLLQGHAAA